ncbi:hypothetical protein CCO03_01650 [Comamonas serinivorans]|uniref:DUF4124 domain-containing protein n=1 Tax=Comamonas serinivorans TaxID=1082851 RepID=A0A1Y0EJF7_9BURK|nr:hypothetical protein [Comamonas serinivorans]ARU03561.1 hypothetical protein CCO03_01650 [Comamonas serinivorans]
MFLLNRLGGALLMLAPVWVGAQGLVQEGNPNAPVSTEVHKCVRAGEVFYTNGACPAGTSSAPLNRPSPATRSDAAPLRPLPPPSRAEPPPRPAPAAVQRAAPRDTAPVPLAEPVYQSTLTTVRAHELVPARPPAPEPEATPGFRPLSSFPRLPEAGAGRASGGRAGDQDGEARSAAPVEAPMRGPTKQAEPVADARANNSAMCGFVRAELDRLGVESAGAKTEDAKARIAVHQKRLHDRQAQLAC